MTRTLSKAVWLVALLPALAAAESPKSPAPLGKAPKEIKKAPELAASKMEPAVLGRLDALFTICAKGDEKNRKIYEAKRTEMIVFGEGTQYEMRAPGSDTPAYKEAYAAMLEAAGKATTGELASDCRRTIGVDVADKQK